MYALSKYVAVFRINIRQAIAMPLGTLTHGFLMCIRLFFLYVIYAYVYAHTSASSLMPLASVLASLAMYQILLTLNLRRVFDFITKDIRTGMFEVSYLRPMNYLLSSAIARVGHTIVMVVATVFFAILLFPLFSPELPPTLGGAMLLSGIALVLLGVVLSGFMYILIALPALWINDAEPFYYVLDKTVLILGGAYVPVALFPGWLRAIAEYSPFGAVMAATRMFDADFLSRAPIYAASQILWILVLWAVTYLVFQLARKHIAINGG